MCLMLDSEEHTLTTRARRWNNGSSSYAFNNMQIIILFKFLFAVWVTETFILLPLPDSPCVFHGYHIWSWLTATLRFTRKRQVVTSPVLWDVLNTTCESSDPHERRGHDVHTAEGFSLNELMAAQTRTCGANRAVSEVHTISAPAWWSASVPGYAGSLFCRMEIGPRRERKAINYSGEEPWVLHKSGGSHRGRNRL